MYAETSIETIDVLGWKQESALIMLPYTRESIRGNWKILYHFMPRNTIKLLPIEYKEKKIFVFEEALDWHIEKL